jgi:MFS superfamily sulfate permease-like transporter
MVVLVLAVALGLVFGLDHRHTYPFPGHFFDSEHPAKYEVGPRFLVDMPQLIRFNGFEMPKVDFSGAFALPDFRGLATATGVKYVVLFTLIGSLESLLSAKAIDLIDPWKRKTDFNRDVLAQGVANTLSAMIGGLPMISEIVRSKANIDNGAQTRWSNFFHGIFLLAFVLLASQLIHRIPQAALAAMLVYTGFRLASPWEFVKTYKVGVEQLIVFLATIVATLATDLLIGIAVGIGLEVLLALRHGAPIPGLFWLTVDTTRDEEGRPVVRVKRAAVFGNWLKLRSVIVGYAEARGEVRVDLSQTRYVDHSVMEKLEELRHELEASGKKMILLGLEEHKALSPHPHAARKKQAHLLLLGERRQQEEAPSAAANGP